MEKKRFQVLSFFPWTDYFIYLTRIIKRIIQLSTIFYAFFIHMAFWYNFLCQLINATCWSLFRKPFIGMKLETSNDLRLNDFKHILLVLSTQKVFLKLFKKKKLNIFLSPLLNIIVMCIVKLQKKHTLHSNLIF